MLFSPPETSEVATLVKTQLPDIEEVRKMPFDPYPRDPKFKQASPVYTDKKPMVLTGQLKYANRQQRDSLNSAFNPSLEER